MENQNLQPPRERIAGKEEEEEGMEMETFFALVRNFKEMRDRRRKELMIGDGDETAAAEKRRKRMKTAKAVQNPSTWIPRFEREDFDEDFQVRGPAPPLVFPRPCNLVKEETAATATVTEVVKIKKKVKSEEDCLDLNLAL